MARPVLALVALFALLAAPLFAAPPPTLKVPFERYRLRNGLTVILHEDHRQPTVVVDLWFRVGSQDERAGRSGFAHLFEHLMFMGTERVPNGGFDAIMEAHGGSNNASTSEDFTNYFDLGPSSLLETFLFLEADRLGTLAEAMTKEKLDLQRDVVKNERRQRYENRPYGRVELVLPVKMFPAGHPYHQPVIGSHEDLTAAAVDDVKDFFRTFYVPANASLVVAGDFKASEARRLVARYFDGLATRPEPVHVTPPPVKLPRAETVALTDAVQLDQVTIAYHAPATFAAGEAESELLAGVLGAGTASRLYRALVYDLKLAESVEVEHRSQRHGSLLVIVATAQPGHTAAELARAIDAELAALVTRPPTAAELDRARSLAQTTLLTQAEKLFGIADALNSYQFYLGDPGELSRRLLARYDAVTPATLRQRLGEVLVPERLLITVTPAGKPKPPPATAPPPIPAPR